MNVIIIAPTYPFVKFIIHPKGEYYYSFTKVTVPAPIRDIFNLKKGSTVIFKVTDKGILFMPCEIKEKDAYSQEEWGKIERLVAERGKS